MTTPRPGSRAEQRRRTEARILDAAAQVFAADGYERTTIRGVASAAGVDAGLVMHYFGSKQELFKRVIDEAPVPEVSGTPGQAAEQILAALASRLVNEPVASLTLLRSMLTNPEARTAASAAVTRYQAEISQEILAALASRLVNEPVASLTLLRSMLTNPEARTAASAAVTRYQAEIAQ